MNNLNLSRARGGLVLLLAMFSGTAMSAGTQQPAAAPGVQSAAPAYAGEAAQGYAYPGTTYSAEPGYYNAEPGYPGYYQAEPGYNTAPGYAPSAGYQATDPYAGYSVDPYGSYSASTPYPGYGVAPNAAYQAADPNAAYQGVAPNAAYQAADPNAAYQGVAPNAAYQAADPNAAYQVADPNASYQAAGPYPGYTADPNAGYADPYAGYSYDPYAYSYPAYPSSGMPAMPQGGWPGGRDNNPLFGRDNPIFGGDNPFENPFDTHGYWADKNFQPWQSGPFERDRWSKDHPMANMPWGNFPGWGDGFFGGFGPDSWEGVTPWGNDVPFKWVEPSNPRNMIGDIWDDALNTPNRLGRMPPGWTAPYISVPNPIDVEEEFERNARKFPDEMRKAINTGDGDFGNAGSGGKEKGKDGKPKPFIERVKPVGPIFDKPIFDKPLFDKKDEQEQQDRRNEERETAPRR